MRVFLGSDHAAFELKEHLVKVVGGAGHEAIDCGAHVYDAEDDYPPFCFEVGERVVAEPGSLGVVLGGSGNGEQIAANKVPGIRAALAWNRDTATLARQHSLDEAAQLVLWFLETPFSGDPRHVRRIGLVSDYERDRHRPAGGLPTHTQV
jgi:ribose 5-phosphate isomerase B